MNVQPYLFFDGRCEEALDFYKKSLGAKVEMLMRFKENPDGMNSPMCPPGTEEKILHASFKVGDTQGFRRLRQGQPRVQRFLAGSRRQDRGRGRHVLQGAGRRRRGAHAAHQDILLAKVRYVRRQVRRRLDDHG